MTREDAFRILAESGVSGTDAETALAHALRKSRATSIDRMVEMAPTTPQERIILYGSDGARVVAILANWLSR